MIVSHDMPVIVELCPRTVCMNAGAVIADESTRAVLTDPVVVGQMSEANRPITARDAATTRRAIEAIVPEAAPLRSLLKEELARLRS